MPRIADTIYEAWQKTLERKRVTASGCWEYLGGRSSRGYGHCQFERRTVSIHRLSAAVNLGLDLASPLMVCHHCDNPPCFNPEHLFIGTGSDNIRDSVRKGRQKEVRKTHCSNGHPFSDGNTRRSRTGKRICVECAQAGLRKRYFEANPDIKPRGKRTKASQFRGVSLDLRKEQPWRARIKAGDREKWLGYFSTEIEAAMAYNQAAKSLFGDAARLNQLPTGA